MCFLAQQSAELFIKAALVRRGEVQPRTPEAATIVDPYMQDESVFDAMDTQVRRTVPIVARALRGA